MGDATTGRRKAALITLTGLAMLAAAACGGGAGGEESGTIRIGSVPTLSATKVFVAAEQQLAEEDGYELQMNTVAGAGSTNQVAALLSGDLDVISSGTNTVIDAMAEGADLRIIGSVAPLLYSVVLDADVAADLGVAADAPTEEKVRALKGLKIAASPPGSTGNTVLRTLLENAGLDPERDVELVPLTDAGAIPAGIAQGTFDGSFFAVGSGEVNVADGTGTLWLSIPQGDFPELDDYVGVVMVASGRFVEERPEAAKAVHDALERAYELTKEDPQTVAQLMREEVLPEASTELFDEVWSQVGDAYESTSFTQQQWDTFVRLFDDSSDKDYAALDYQDVVAEVARG